MATRRKRAGLRPLEWVAVDVAKAANEGITLEVVNFQMDNDELVEILKIETEIKYDIPATIVDDTLLTSCALVADPTYSTSASAYGEAVYEDEETFYTHQYCLQIDVGTVDMVIKENDTKEMNFTEGSGILLGKNAGFLCSDDVGIAVAFNLRVYFKRRKASDRDLVNILLKNPGS